MKHTLNDKRIIIYGVGKVQADFEYLFDTFPPEYYVVDNIETFDRSRHGDLPVFSKERLLTENRREVMIIICEKIKDEAETFLRANGFSRRINYLYADDFFDEYDFDLAGHAGHRKIAIWGTGRSKDRLIEACDFDYLNEKVACYVESHTPGEKRFCNGRLPRPIINYRDLPSRNDMFVIIANAYYDDIAPLLTDMGYDADKDFIHSSVLSDNIASEMIKKTVYGRPLAGMNCTWPFEHINIQPHETFICGWPSWLPISIGNVRHDDLTDMWTSFKARIVRLSILNHTYSFCLNNVCPKMDLIPIYDDDYVMTKAEVRPVPATPEVVSISHDDLCNLKCSSCRHEIYAKHSEPLSHAIRNANANILRSNFLYNAKHLGISGNGEVFFSPYLRQLLFADSKRQAVLIQTNGTLVTSKDIEDLKKIYDRIEFAISIDAATDNTYKKLRGGNWKQLVRNLEMLSQYRLKQEIKRVRLNFVIQKDNYSEIIPFIMMAKKYRFDWIYFSRIQNFSEWPDEVFNDKSMLYPTGIMKDELKEIFRDELLKDPIVDITQFYRNIDLSGLGEFFPESKRKQTTFFLE